jgi:hypothetical protein
MTLEEAVTAAEDIVAARLARLGRPNPANEGPETDRR